MREHIIMIFLLTFFIGCGGEDMNVTVMTPTIQCGMCQKNIEVGLSKLDGVGRSTVDLASKTTKVSFDSKKTDLLKIENAIADLGYQANAVSANPNAYETLPDCCKIGGMDKM